MRHCKCGNPIPLYQNSKICKDCKPVRRCICGVPITKRNQRRCVLCKRDEAEAFRNKIEKPTKRNLRKEVMMYMRFVDRKTCDYIASCFGISRERVRQIIGNTGFVAIYSEQEQDDGVVRWYKDERERFLTTVYKEDNGCWNLPGSKRAQSGYSYVSCGSNHFYGHQISWKVFRGEIPKDQWVLHKCGNAYCVNPDHLYLGDATDNARDRTRHTGNTKELFDLPDLLKIKRLRTDGLSYKSIAKEMSCSPATIMSMLLGRTKRYNYLVGGADFWKNT